MPPKVTDTRTAQNEALHKVEEKTAAGARRIVATFAEDFYDAVTLMCMLGVEKEGLSFKKVHEEYEKENAPKTAKRTRKSTKKTAKKSAKKAAKKTTRKTAKKAAKKAAKKTTKKAAKKTTKKAAS
ncbi:hypothetical protein QP923_02470 [Corynebacterium sp. MSK151]|uniref:hypothetical protein n=1 Tax=unclassified Corynebacterium TaxID=2624378 RepID=UPI00254BA481|nr:MULTISPECIES: hypothetical protein [unclassified Corynebacterium]MDK8758459.1 hypothetical protein [Corynebacterium sp. MSK151]MDK8847562.1 hypothetical protein [Corynebacterium sp. MSK047]